MRLSRLVGTPYSVTTHAFDIYVRTTNLHEKLRRAAFVTAGSDYTLEDVRRIVGRRHAARVHKVVMGVDPDRFRRLGLPRWAHGGRGRPAGPKKGFRYLLEAAARLQGSSSIDRLVILGDGPLRKRLRRRAAALGVADVVEWMGARSHGEVRRSSRRQTCSRCRAWCCRTGTATGARPSRRRWRWRCRWWRATRWVSLRWSGSRGDGPFPRATPPRSRTRRRRPVAPHGGARGDGPGGASVGPRDVQPAPRGGAAVGADRPRRRLLRPA